MGCSVSVFADNVNSAYLLCYEEGAEPKAILEAFKTKFEILLNRANNDSDLTDLGSFLTQHIISNAVKYNELGILDEMLDAVFNEKTGITPNTDFKDYSSFFKIAALDAAYGNENGKIVFEKLQQRGGDAECEFYPFGSSAAETVELICDTYCGEDAKTGDKQVDEYNDRLCTGAKDIFARMGCSYPRAKE